MRRLTICVIIALLCATAADARSRRKRPQGSNQPGVFDYYVFSLSWSPEHCASHNDSPQCDGGRKFGFVAHGLWPQFERGYPQDCGGPILQPRQIPKDLMDIMPSEQLIEHEWSKHGTCSGLGIENYFKKIEDAYAEVTIPREFKAPIQKAEVSPAEIKSKFVAANRGFPESSVKVLCSGRFLQEVRVCLDKDLKARACGTDVKDTCRNATIIMPPVR
jgi:ribonuclease T2